MSSLDKLFSNSLKNDITHSFVESVEAIMFLEGISSEDFLKKNQVNVYTPIIKEDFSIYKQKKLSFTQEYEYTETHYDILGIWLYKLSENFRRLYSAHKNPTSVKNLNSLIEQQNNLYTISNYFLEHWDTDNEETFFPRAIFGRHSDYLQPIHYLIYLGTHNSLSSDNFEKHLNIVKKLTTKLEIDNLPDFLPKLALSSTNSKLLKTLLPLFSPNQLVSLLQYDKTSDGFKILSFEYIFENPSKFDLPNYEKTSLISKFLHEDILLSKYFDDFILDKSNYLEKLSAFINPSVSKDLESVFVRKMNKNSYYKNFQSLFILNKKKTNHLAFSFELPNLSFEELDDQYDLSPSIITEAINHIILNNELKVNKTNKNYLEQSLKSLVDKLHPVITKEHLASIISLNNNFISFCKPIYLNIKINEKLSINSTTNQNTSSLKKNKI